MSIEGRYAKKVLNVVIMNPCTLCKPHVVQCKKCWASCIKSLERPVLLNLYWTLTNDDCTIIALEAEQTTWEVQTAENAVIVFGCLDTFWELMLLTF